MKRGFKLGSFLTVVLVSLWGVASVRATDYYVNILDLGIIATNFGKISGYDPEADVVENTEIDTFDVVFVASKFT